MFAKKLKIITILVLIEILMIITFFKEAEYVI